MKEYIEKKYRSRQNAVVKAERLTEKVGRMCELNEPVIQDICIAVTEAVNNAVEHGNNFQPQKFVTVSIDCTADALSITVLDEGSGFDLAAVEDPLAPENISKPNGRGLLIVQSIMDEVEITPSTTGTKVVMIKKR